MDDADRIANELIDLINRKRNEGWIPTGHSARFRLVEEEPAVIEFGNEPPEREIDALIVTLELSRP